jgi:hypothetical protein
MFGSCKLDNKIFWPNGDYLSVVESVFAFSYLESQAKT